MRRLVRRSRSTSKSKTYSKSSQLPLPTVLRAGYSAVEAGAWIRPHFGETNAQLKAQANELAAAQAVPCRENTPSAAVLSRRQLLMRSHAASLAPRPDAAVLRR